MRIKTNDLTRPILILAIGAALWAAVHASRVEQL
jgi:hypothetical protein